jgi:hypothetical protein
MPSEIVAALRSDDEAQRETAGRALLTLVAELASTPLIERSTKQLYRIPEAERDEAVQRAVFRFVARLARPAPIFENAEDVDLACAAYLRTVLVRTWLQMNRERGREQPVDGERLDRERAPVDTPDAQLERARVQAEASVRVAQIRAVLDRVAERVITDLRGPEAQAKGRQTWTELCRLVFENGTMEELVGPDAFDDPKDFVRARNAIYAAHSRFRKAMALPAAQKPSAIRRMAETGQLTAEEAALAESAMVLLAR